MYKKDWEDMTKEDLEFYKSMQESKDSELRKAVKKYMNYVNSETNEIIKKAKQEVFDDIDKIPRINFPKEYPKLKEKHLGK